MASQQLTTINRLANRVTVASDLVNIGHDVNKNIRLNFAYYKEMAEFIQSGSASEDDYELMAASFSRIVESTTNAIFRDDKIELLIRDIQSEIHPDFMDEIVGVAA